MPYLRAGLPGYYRLHGTSIEVRWDDAGVACLVHAILDYFGFARCADVPPRCHVQVSFLTRAAPPALPKHARPVLRDHGLTFQLAQGRVYLCEGDSIMCLDAATGTGRGIIRSPLWRTPGEVRCEVVNFVIDSLLILLRRLTLYPLHAAAIEKDGQGVLLVAESDSGKSTQALSLVRQGWRYLSDDAVLLRPLDAHVEAVPLRRDFCLDPETTDLFPEIDSHWEPLLTDARKRRVHMEVVYPEQGLARCVPHVLVFPQIARQPQSRLAPMSRKEALFRLMRNSVLLTVEPCVAAAHLAVLNRLTHQAAAYRLFAGEDLLQDPALTARLLTRVLSEPSTETPLKRAARA